MCFFSPCGYVNSFLYFQCCVQVLVYCTSVIMYAAALRAADLDDGEIYRRFRSARFVFASW